MWSFRGLQRIQRGFGNFRGFQGVPWGHQGVSEGFRMVSGTALELLKSLRTALYTTRKTSEKVLTPPEQI